MVFEAQHNGDRLIRREDFEGRYLVRQDRPRLLSFSEEKHLGARVFLAQLSLRGLQRLAGRSVLDVALQGKIDDVMSNKAATALLQEFKKVIAVEKPYTSGDIKATPLAVIDLRYGEWLDRNFPSQIAEQSKMIDQLSKRISVGIQSRDDLIVHNLRLVGNLVRKHRNNSSLKEDIEGYGIEGLMIASSRFDYRKGNRFSTYAYRWIDAYMRRKIYDLEYIVRVPVEVHNDLKKVSAAEGWDSIQGLEAQSLEEVFTKGDNLKSGVLALNVVSIDRSVSQDSKDAPELSDYLVSREGVDDQAINVLMAKVIWSEVESVVGKRKADILRLLYIGELSIQEIADKMGQSRQSIQQLRKSALILLGKSESDFFRRCLMSYI